MIAAYNSCFFTLVTSLFSMVVIINAIRFCAAVCTERDCRYCHPPNRNDTPARMNMTAGKMARFSMSAYETVQTSQAVNIQFHLRRLHAGISYAFVAQTGGI